MGRRLIGLRVEYADAPMLLQYIKDQRHVSPPDSPVRQLFDDLVRSINILLEADEKTIDRYVERAGDLYHRDGEIEIDDDAMLSLSKDGGEYVSAWVWVPDDVEEDFGVEEAQS